MGRRIRQDLQDLQVYKRLLDGSVEGRKKGLLRVVTGRGEA